MGIGGLIAGGYMAFDTLAFLDRAQVVDAVVVDFVSLRSSDGWTDYPVFRFVDVNGDEVFARGTWNIDFSIGEVVEIYYDTKNPSGNVFAGGLNVWGPALILLGFGLSFAGIGAFLFIKLGDEEIF